MKAFTSGWVFPAIVAIVFAMLFMWSLSVHNTLLTVLDGALFAFNAYAAYRAYIARPGRP